MRKSSDTSASGTDPDAELVRRIGRGETPAFAELMDRHLGRVVAHATRMTGDRVMAEDIAQTVFLKLWQTAPKWRFEQAKIASWIHRVTTHSCIDRLRRNRVVYPGQVPETVDMGPAQDEVMMAQDDAATISQAIARLPERQRAAISLSYFEGLSQKQGAEILDVSESAYEALLMRARKSLRRQLLGNRNLQILTGGKQ